MRLRVVAVLSLVGAIAVPVLAGWNDSVSAVGKLGPSERRCFSVAGSAGDAALVNLTMVEADGAGNGQLISSDVVSPPVASNVNFGIGTVDPNVAVAPIGADGQVCYVNSNHTSVHLIADHLGTISAASFQKATASGAPLRTVDTRTEVPPPTTTTAPATTVPPNCDPSYPTVCIPPPPPDLDCGDIVYRNFVVLQPDPHNFDGNNDGIGCVE
jgi:hypothetical protein